jgi:hypothetical protein
MECGKLRSWSVGQEQDVKQLFVLFKAQGWKLLLFGMLPLYLTTAVVHQKDVEFSQQL